MITQEIINKFDGIVTICEVLGHKTMEVKKNSKKLSMRVDVRENIYALVIEDDWVSIFVLLGSDADNNPFFSRTIHDYDMEKVLDFFINNYIK